MKHVLFVFASVALLCSCGSLSDKEHAGALRKADRRYDVLIVGGGVSGTSAAIQSARSGAKTLLVEEHEWLGGMLTSAGVSATDGCYFLRGGIWSEFRDSLEAEYGGTEALKTGWVSNVLFEPSVGNRIFKNIAAREGLLDVVYGCVPVSFKKLESGWDIVLESGGIEKKTRARILVDATELGDVAKAVGVPYRIGMDSRLETGEACAPEEANDIIQDLTFVMILKDYGHPVPVPEPEGYTPEEFRGCCRSELCPDCSYDWTPSYMMKYGKIARGKYMINWPLEGNDYYLNIIEMTPEERVEALKAAKAKSLRFLYFLQTEFGFVNLGLADDEYPTDDGFPFIPYHRESRRIDGRIMFTVNDILEPHSGKLYRTTVAVGDYPVDHHHSRYSGSVPLPKIDFPVIPSYGLPVGVMMPSGTEDLLVIEKSISVTNIVNGSTRLQPVVLQLGQAAGIVAAEVVKSGKAPCDVPVRKIQQELLDAGAYILPLLDVPSGDKAFKSYQKIAATGILEYYGRHAGWVNQSWLDASRPMDADVLISGLTDFYVVEAGLPGIVFPHSGEGTVDTEMLAGILSRISAEPVDVGRVAEVLEDVFGKEYAADTELTRGETAVAIDFICDPFGSYGVDLEGNLVL